MKLRLQLAVVSAAAALVACATDNGSNVFGPTFGPSTDKDGSASSSSSSSSSSSGGGDTDGGGSSGSDGGGDAAAPCTSGTVAVLAGNDTTLSGAVQDKGGAWTGAAIAGSSAFSRPALVAFGQGFLGVTQGTGGLQSVTYKGGWSPASTIGKAGVKGPPALAVAGTSAHVVYAAGPGPNRDFFHGIHDGNAWNTADATVGINPNQSFGTIGAGLAGAGNTAVFVENGSDYKLYTRTWDGAWPAGAGTEIAGAASVGTDFPAPPVVVAAEGKNDLVAFYVQKEFIRLSYATRDATTKEWTDRGVIHMLATTKEPFSAARIGQSTYLVTFRGEDGNGYYAQGTVDVAGAFTWAAAQSIGGGANVIVDSAPAVARGVCGDDAIVVFPTSGTVKATRLRGTTWTAPAFVTGASGTRVAVATK